MKALIDHMNKNALNPIAMKRHSRHTGDCYLFVVLYEKDNGEFVVHGYNAETDGLFQGDYYRDLPTAFARFNERGAHPLGRK